MSRQTELPQQTQLPQQFQQQSKLIPFTKLVVVLLLLVASIAISAANGQADIQAADVWTIIFYKLSNGALDFGFEGLPTSAINIIWFVRMPRVILAIFVGMGLAVSGSVMQAVVQNPLADPYILGVSSGASLGATFAILVGFGTTGILSQFGVSFGAFAGALCASLAVLVLSSVGGRMTSVKLVLSGTVVSALFSAVSNFIVFFANNSEGIKTVTFWSMGSLASANWEKLPLLSVMVLATVLLLCTQSRILNVMLLGDEAAVTLGIQLALYRKLYMTVTALLTGLIVANSGMIGFVGLIIPHIVRGFFGSDYKVALPSTAVLGSLFLVWCDLLSRIVMHNVELPIGIVTSMIGAPLFIYIIVKRGYNFGGA